MPNSLDSRPHVDDLPCDAGSVRQRSIAAILLRGIRRCIAADRELNDEPTSDSPQDEPVFDNLGDSLPEHSFWGESRGLEPLAPI